MSRKPLSEVIVFTREGCHLCDDVIALLVRYGLAPRTVDIDVDCTPEVRSRYTDCVPVVVIEGVERFRGRVDEVLLRRLLARR